MENIKILSFDVGIKNLAYCLIEKKDDEFEIKKWNLINLVDDRTTCQCTLRGGNKCSGTAKFCIYHKDKEILFDDLDDGIMNVCIKHKIKMMPEIEEIKYDKKKKQEKKICKICQKEAKYELTNTKYYWCDEHYEKKGKSFVKKINAKKVSFKSCGKHPMQELSEKLYNRFDKEPDFLTVNKVLIENQPSLRNPTMKTIASLIFGYFILRGIIDTKKTDEVRFVCPSNKLRINDVETKKVLLKENDKTINYKLTKNLGIKYCRALITDKNNKYLDDYKKKDDLCDAFLQGFQYLYNPVPQKFFEKLKIIGFDETKKPKKKKEEIKKGIIIDE